MCIRDRDYTHSLPPQCGSTYYLAAHMLGNEEEIIFAATDLLDDTKLAPELSNEAHYYRAKAYLDAGKTDGAMEDLKGRKPFSCRPSILLLWLRITT